MQTKGFLQRMFSKMRTHRKYFRLSQLTSGEELGFVGFFKRKIIKYMYNTVPPLAWAEG